MDEKKRILVVDDSAVNLATIKQKISDVYDVVTINSGERALRFLKDERPDLILLDVLMEPKNGIETLKEIRRMKNREDIPVIMLTSKSDRDTILTSSKYGIYDYVLKPFDIDNLHIRIKRALEKYEESQKAEDTLG